MRQQRIVVNVSRDGNARQAQPSMSCIDRHQGVTASNKIRQRRQVTKRRRGESITLLSEGERKGKINRRCHGRQQELWQLLEQGHTVQEVPIPIAVKCYHEQQPSVVVVSMVRLRGHAQVQGQSTDSRRGDQQIERSHVQYNLVRGLWDPGTVDGLTSGVHLQTHRGRFSLMPIVGQYCTFDLNWQPSCQKPVILLSL